MKATLFAVALVPVAFTVSLAQNSAFSVPTPSNPSQLKALVKSAKTPDDYSTLSNYFSHIAEADRLKAADEKKEWERRAANPLIYGRKYPSSIDTARSRYEWYAQRAKDSAALAQRYDELARTER